jgi:hypothetical protein
MEKNSAQCGQDFTRPFLPGHFYKAFKGKYRMQEEDLEG